MQILTFPLIVDPFFASFMILGKSREAFYESLFIGCPIFVLRSLIIATITTINNQGRA